MNIYLIASEDHKVFGVGQTTRSYEERHHDGDWSKFHNYLKARGEELQLIGWWEDVDITDHDIHKWLVKLPNVRKFAEWFSHKSSLAVVKDMITSQFFATTPERKLDLVLRPHQQAFINKAKQDYQEFLLFAKCRAGKSVMTLSHILDKGHKLSLVVSRFNSPQQSWCDDIANFNQFSNMTFVDMRDKTWLDQLNYWIATEKQVVLWSTVQGVVRKLTKLPAVDFLVFDECHIGSSAKQFKAVRDAMSNAPCLQVSGTAYDQVWDYSDRNRYVYSYYEEQLDVQAGLYHRPKMNVITVSYDSQQYQSLFGDDPDAMKNIFAVDGDQFINPELVRDFIHTYFNPQRKLRPADRLLKDSQHIYITLPSVTACRLFADMITSYSPLVVTGDTNKSAVDIEKHIAENEKTITITRMANVMGVTNKSWDTIINCAEGKSVEFWTQFAFRGGSSDNDWRVIDFCPQRCLESLRQSYVMACDSNPALTEWSFVDFVPVYEWAESFKQLTQDDITAALAADVGNTIKLMSSMSTRLDFDKLRDMVFEASMKADSDITHSVMLTDNNANGKGNKSLETDIERNERDDIYSKIDTIKYILERLPKVIYYMINNGNTPTTLADVLSYDTYEVITDDKEDILNTALQLGVIDNKMTSYRISQACIDIKQGIKTDKTMTLETLALSDETQQTIPATLLTDMIQL